MKIKELNDEVKRITIRSLFLAGIIGGIGILVLFDISFIEGISAGVGISILNLFLIRKSIYLMAEKRKVTPVKTGYIMRYFIVAVMMFSIASTRNVVLFTGMTIGIFIPKVVIYLCYIIGKQGDRIWRRKKDYRDSVGS